MREERFLTVQQAAEVAQVHPETMREWCRRGRIPATLISRRAGWRIRQSDLEAFLSGELTAPEVEAEGKARAAA